MCRVYSCVINRQGKVWDDPATHSHEEIIGKHNLCESIRETVGDYTFAKIEIVPKNKNDYWNTRKTGWEFVLDEEREPEWFGDKHIEACWNAWKRWRKEYVLKCKKISRIEDKDGLFVYDCEIGSLHNSTVKTMRGNSTVKAMRDNSTVKAMRDNSIIISDGENAVAVSKWRTIKIFEKGE